MIASLFPLSALARLRPFALRAMAAVLLVVIGLQALAPGPLSPQLVERGSAFSALTVDVSLAPRQDEALSSQLVALPDPLPPAPPVPVISLQAVEPAPVVFAAPVAPRIVSPRAARSAPIAAGATAFLIPLTRRLPAQRIQENIMTNEVTGAMGAERRAHVEATLARYPDISDEELQDMLHWFRREATALEVGLIASNDDIRQAYVRFRVDELERMTTRDYALITAVTVALLGALVFVIVVYT